MLLKQGVRKHKVFRASELSNAAIAKLLHIVESASVAVAVQLSDGILTLFKGLFRVC